MAPRRRKPRPIPLPPPPPRSARLYVRLARQDIALFRFLLEAHDNLAVFTVALWVFGIVPGETPPWTTR